MKRIAIYYDSRITGRNDGNPLYIWRALKRRQEKGELEVDNIAPNGENYDKFGKYDLNIWVDWGEDGLRDIIPYKVDYPPAHPLVYWASDTHLGAKYRFDCAMQADYVFFAQKEAIDEYKKYVQKEADKVTSVTANQKINLLPHAFEPEAYPKIDYASKKYDISFVGHVNSENRIEALDTLFKNFPNFYFGQKRFEDASRLYAQSKISFNISMKKELNMRVFEIMGSGNFLLTDDIPMIHDYFKDGVHCAMYKDEKEMIGKAIYYLAHDEEREKIALAGYKETLKHHTIDMRLDKILETVTVQENVSSR